MELRDHPGVRYAGVKSWPPVWSSLQHIPRTRLQGEIGVLTSAYTTSAAAKICFLIIEHEAESYVGALMLDDRALCAEICQLLKKNLGHPIAEIGGLDLGYPI